MPISPVLRGWHPLGVAGQSSFFFYGVHRDEEVTRLHPPPRTMEGHAVQSVCGRDGKKVNACFSSALCSHRLFTCKRNIAVLSGICTHTRQTK